jgi:hypothetical protein
LLAIAAGAIVVLGAVALLARPGGQESAQATPALSAEPSGTPMPSLPRATLMDPSEAPRPNPCAPAPTMAPAVAPGRFELTLGQCFSDFPRPLILLDETGLVLGVENVQPPEDLPAEGLTVAQSPYVGLDYTWATGACDALITITLSRTSPGLRLDRDVVPTTDGCFAVGIRRQLRVLTSVAIDPGDVAIPSFEP